MQSSLHPASKISLSRNVKLLSLRFVEAHRINWVWQVEIWMKLFTTIGYHAIKFSNSFHKLINLIARRTNKCIELHCILFHCQDLFSYYSIIFSSTIHNFLRYLLLNSVGIKLKRRKNRRERSIQIEKNAKRCDLREKNNYYGLLIALKHL